MDKKEMLKWMELIYQEIGSMPGCYGLGRRDREALEDIIEILKEEINE